LLQQDAQKKRLLQGFLRIPKKRPKTCQYYPNFPGEIVDGGKYKHHSCRMLLCFQSLATVLARSLGRVCRNARGPGLSTAGVRRPWRIKELSVLECTAIPFRPLRLSLEFQAVGREPKVMATSLPCACIDSRCLAPLKRRVYAVEACYGESYSIQDNP